MNSNINILKFNIFSVKSFYYNTGFHIGHFDFSETSSSINTLFYLGLRRNRVIFSFNFFLQSLLKISCVLINTKRASNLIHFLITTGNIYHFAVLSKIFSIKLKSQLVVKKNYLSYLKILINIFNSSTKYSSSIIFKPRAGFLNSYSKLFLTSCEASFYSNSLKYPRLSLSRDSKKYRGSFLISFGDATFNISLKESRTNLLPVIALVDSNQAFSNYADYVIPGNDDSLGVIFFLSFFFLDLIFLDF